jgi:DNA-binding response OmpR family regulator
MTNIKNSCLRILVVEDNADIRQIMKDLLESFNHEVHTAKDGECGIVCLQENIYDLLITDLGLPGLSGWDLAKASKRYQTNMPVLAISSWQGKDAEQKIGAYGISQVIWKPFRFKQIEHAIAFLCAVSPEENSVRQ